MIKCKMVVNVSYEEVIYVLARIVICNLESKAMYKAKSEERNCVRVITEECAG